MNNIPYYHHTHHYFHKMSILKIDDLFEFHVAKYMYRHSTGNLSESLKVLLSYRHTRSHSYNTRNILIPFSNCKNIGYKGPFIWNQIPPTVKNAHSINSFKSQFKRSLLSKYMGQQCHHLSLIICIAKTNIFHKSY